MSRDSYWPSLLYLSLTTLQHGLSNCSLNRSSLVINGSQGRPPNLSFAAFTQADQRSLDLLSSLGLEANPSARLIYSFLLSQVLLMISFFFCTEWNSNVDLVFAFGTRLYKSNISLLSPVYFLPTEGIKEFYPKVCAARAGRSRSHTCQDSHPPNAPHVCHAPTFPVLFFHDF